LTRSKPAELARSIVSNERQTIAQRTTAECFHEISYALNRGTLGDFYTMHKELR